MAFYIPSPGFWGRNKTVRQSREKGDATAKLTVRQDRTCRLIIGEKNFPNVGICLNLVRTVAAPGEPRESPFPRGFPFNMCQPPNRSDLSILSPSSRSWLKWSVGYKKALLVPVEIFHSFPGKCI